MNLQSRISKLEKATNETLDEPCKHPKCVVIEGEQQAETEICEECRTERPLLIVRISGYEPSTGVP